jgi:PAS domain S-box-containing protein
MNGATTPTIIAIVVQLGLGLAVFYANPRKKSNQSFLFLSLVIIAWLASLYLAFSAKNARAAEFAIRQASATAVLYLTGLNLLRIAIRQKQQSWPDLVRHSRIWLLLAAAIILFCQTKIFLVGAQMPERPGAAAPMAIYGPAVFHVQPIWIYGAYCALSFVALIILYWRDLRRTSGSERVEIAFILIGGVGMIAASVLLTFVVDLFIPQSQWIWFAPFRMLLFSLVIAYGVATKKIMDVGVLLRRIMSYTLLAAYLLTLYGLVWWLVATVLRASTPNAGSIAHVAAAIVVAFAMAPARGMSQRLAERLFISAHRLDFRTTVSKAAKILASVTTLRDLLNRFAKTVAEAANTDRVLILLGQKNGYAQQHPIPTRQSQLDLPKDHPIVNYLKATGQPIVLDELHRARPTAEIHRVIHQMQHLNLAVAMGIFARDQLEGLMLLGPRVTGRVYGEAEQEALQVLSGQLAVAIENAQLFTEVQNAKIYNETLLQNLTTGVIAAGADERITVFNNEAGQITGVDSEGILECRLSDLPQSLGGVLQQTLLTGEAQIDSEMIFNPDGKEIIARVSTSIFHDQDQQVLGALMVLTDITTLKRLESQIRRSDRLASLGTLSAGMAHEIKNPLVSIKTFAQLLPERYQDSDFRETFSNLIGHEIDRIDSLVNQLLRFARPTKPLLRPMHVHEILEKSLSLIGHRMYQKEIKLTRSLEANVDTIRADADQLEQVFLNFFLNAMDAMKNGGELAVNTHIHTDERWISALTHGNGGTAEVLRITIRDTGEGIRKQDIPHVFDPFFTTKDYGTGLGLSVVHGIIQEHGGQIEVESELKKGTAFHVLLPLVRFDSEVAVA